MARGWRVQLMPGVERGRDGVKIDTKRRMGTPYLCLHCIKAEETKLIHLDLDETDSRIVSDGVLEQLQECGAIGTVLEVTNEVTTPPQMWVSMGARLTPGDFAYVEVST